MYKIPANTLFIGKKIIYVPECHSTNDLATQIALQPSVHEGTIVITDRQLHGRGQRGNQWLSEHYKNITLSLIVRPTFLDPKDQFLLNIVISLGVFDYLKTVIADGIFLKWPNDMMVQDKKIAGILIENQLRGNRFVYSIAGIGLNVNQVQFPVPAATSLSLQAQKEFPLPEVLVSLLEKIESRYLQLKQGSFQALKEDYLQALYWRDELRNFSVDGQQVAGVIKGLDPFGRLHLQVAGADKFFGVKEIEYIV